MSSNQPLFQMETSAGVAVPLQRVCVHSDLRHLLCETSITQYYHNQEDANIEAVYTFPLPSEAILLGLNVTIGERELTGVVVEKQAAVKAYEEAITDGDQAIMLEQARDGLYTLNVGNLQPGEKVSVQIRYALLLRWQGSEVRYQLPTTIAPRYGNAEAAGLQGHQIPQTDISHDNRFEFKLSVHGVLQQTAWSCPSHELVSHSTGEETVFSLHKENASMDRDLVLAFEHHAGGENFTIVDPDREGYTVLACFYPRFDRDVDAPQPARNFKLVIDCSGSMGGDSIAQAKQALLEILRGLRPQDEFNIVAFGSTHQKLFAGQVEATSQNVRTAMAYTRQLRANFGGTEMESALVAAMESSSDKHPSGNILLITDGEIWSELKVIAKAKALNHRIFAVAIGTSPAENVLRTLSRETEGALEFVYPGEGISEKIVRQFQRIYLPVANPVRVQWPGAVMDQQPQCIASLYDGDTCYCFAQFAQRPEGMVTLRAELEGGERLQQQVRIVAAPKTESSSPGVIARMRAQQKLSSLKQQDAIDLAVAYQLVSRYTNTLVIDVRAEGDQAKALPELRKVPQNLAAGWGATSTVLAGAAPCETVMQMELSSSSMPPRLEDSLAQAGEEGNGLPLLDQAFDRGLVDGYSHEGAPVGRSLADLWVEWVHTSGILPPHFPTLDELMAILRLPESIKGELAKFAEAYSEEQVVIALIAFLTPEDLRGGGRQLKRQIRKWHKAMIAMPVPTDLRARVALAVSDL